jgi:hypothetical protein
MTALSPSLATLPYFLSLGALVGCVYVVRRFRKNRKSRNISIHLGSRPGPDLWRASSQDLLTANAPQLHSSDYKSLALHPPFVLKLVLR